MPDTWDRPSFPTRGNKSDRVLFEAIGRALNAWEQVETALALRDIRALLLWGLRQNWASRRGVEILASSGAKITPGLTCRKDSPVERPGFEPSVPPA